MKPMKAAFGSALRMFSARVSYWLRCASSVMTMMSSRPRAPACRLALREPELVDQREDVAVVLAQQLRAGVADSRPAPASSVDRAGVGEPS